MGSWTRRGLWAGGVLLLAAMGTGLALVGPFLLDDMALDRSVRAVALEWRDFGEERAWERLQYELDHEDIGMQVADEDCDLRQEGSRRVVRCRWEAEVRLPFTQRSRTLHFESTAAVTEGGNLH